MSRADLLRSLSAPPELVEADLIDQLADASSALDRLRARTPSEPDASWDRAYARAQSTYLKALSALQKHRKVHPALQPAPATIPTDLAPFIPPGFSTAADNHLFQNLDSYDPDDPDDSHDPDDPVCPPKPTTAAPVGGIATPISRSRTAQSTQPPPPPLNRRERRRLEALRRSAASRAQRRPAASPS